MRKLFLTYILTAIIEIKNPKILPTADNLPLYRLFASGISSPATTYIIAPAAKLKHIAIISTEMLPTTLPKNAPIPVVSPDNITRTITFREFIPPFFIGTDIEIPSGISCIRIVIPKDKPSLIDASNPEPIASPSGYG